MPSLADRNVYIASESTFYRILSEEGQLAHRQHAKPARRHRPKEHVARGPNEVRSWDITYLRSSVRGAFYYLYLIVDIWSRKIVAWSLRHEESSAYARDLIQQAIERESADPKKLALHSDNGGAMKGSTMLATLQRLGVVASFSRPGVSDDNPFSEALFRTLKYRPGFPRKPFEGFEAALLWVDGFVRWYNDEHLHSALRHAERPSRPQRPSPPRQSSRRLHRRSLPNTSAVVGRHPQLGPHRGRVPQPRQAGGQSPANRVAPSSALIGGF